MNEMKLFFVQNYKKYFEKFSYTPKNIFCVELDEDILLKTKITKYKVVSETKYNFVVQDYLTENSKSVLKQFCFLSVGKAKKLIEGVPNDFLRLI